MRAVTTEDTANTYVLFTDGPTVASEGFSDFPHGVPLCHAPAKRAVIEAASSEGRRSVRDVWAMSRQVLSYDLDLFFFPAVYSYFPILNRAKVLVTIHDMIPELRPTDVFPNAKLRAFWQLKQKLAIWQSSIIVTVSEFSRRHIIEQCTLDESRVCVISEGPSPAFRVLPQRQAVQEVLGRYGLEGGAPYLLFVGGLSPHKNLRTLIHAFVQVTRDPQHRDLRLVLVGDYQSDAFYSDYPFLKKTVEEGNLGGKVVFAGFISDQELACFYNAATALVFPSFLEGFGLPAVEAMACGTPVVASNGGSLPEILGDAGCFFDPYNQGQLVDVLGEILTDEGKRRTMSACGLVRAKRFVWEKGAADLVSLFGSMVSEANH